MSETREPSLLFRLWHTPMRDIVRLRVSCRLDWRRVIAQAPIPNETKALLTKLVRKTRLWRIEKADIARELAAHFEDAIATGQGADEVAGLFGDWSRTAKLIRRATKRKRSYLWHVWRWAFWSVVVLIGLYTAMGVYYFTGSRNIAVDYVALMNQEAAAVPEADRGWPIFRDAIAPIIHDPVYEEQFQAGDSIAQGFISVEYLIGDGARPGDEHWGLVDGFLSSHQGGLAELRRAAGMPGLGFTLDYYGYPDDLLFFEPDITREQYDREVAQLKAQFADEPPLTWMLLLPHLTPMRSAARILDVDTFRAVEAGDSQTVYDNLVAMLGLADHADEQNVLINQLVMLAIRQLAFATLSEAIATDPGLFSREQLVNLTHRVARIRKYTFDLTSEHAFMMDLIQHIFTDDGSGNGHLDVRSWHRYANELSVGGTAFVGLGPEPGLAPRLIEIAISPAAVMIVADRKEMATMVDRLYGLYQADMATPIWQQPESRAQTELDDLAYGSLYRRIRYFPLALTMPAIGVRETSERYTGQADGVLTGLALELHRRDHGAYPDTLDALVPKYLPQAPIDRMTGGPLRYRLVHDRPVVYSVGADRDDDRGLIVYDDKGGRSLEVVRWVLADDEEPTDGDWVVWPLHEVHEED